MEIIKEKRDDALPGYLYRFADISMIQNDTVRRLVLVGTFPIFLCVNCLAVIPIIAISFAYNNIELVKTVIKRWNNPMCKNEGRAEK